MSDTSRNHLRTLRQQQRARLKDLARTSGVPASRLCDLERSGLLPRRSTQERIAKALGVEPAVIWPDVPEARR